MNDVDITRTPKGTFIRLNGTELQGVTGFRFEQSSAEELPELTVTLIIDGHLNCPVENRFSATKEGMSPAEEIEQLILKGIKLLSQANEELLKSIGQPDLIALANENTKTMARCYETIFSRPLRR